MDFLYDKEFVEEFESFYNNQPKRFKEVFSKILSRHIAHYLVDMEECQSPIEQLMLLALNYHLDRMLPYFTTDYFITPQEKLEMDGKTYRVDFFIVVRYKGEFNGFVVECDGHDFHEKTKEQARKDKKRDRDIQLLGHPVIRFTGSEIHEDPIACAREVMELIRVRLSGK